MGMTWRDTKKGGEATQAPATLHLAGLNAHPSRKRPRSRCATIVDSRGHLPLKRPSLRWRFRPGSLEPDAPVG
jgi:hypothetical protein